MAKSGKNWLIFLMTVLLTIQVLFAHEATTYPELDVQISQKNITVTASNPATVQVVYENIGDTDLNLTLYIYDDGSIESSPRPILVYGGQRYITVIDTEVIFGSMYLPKGQSRQIDVTFEVPPNMASGNYKMHIGGYHEKIGNTYYGMDEVGFTLLVPSNHNPVIVYATVLPGSGDTNDTYAFKATYSDEDNDPPSVIRVYVDGLPYDMSAVDPSDTNYTDGKEYKYETSLSAGTHNYYIYCEDGRGGSDRNPNSGTLTGPIVSCTAPLAPSLISPVSGATDASLRPTFSWSSVSGATQYTIQVSTTSSFSSYTINQSVSSTSFTPSFNLAENTIYYWRVRAKNDCGNSNWSFVWNFTTCSDKDGDGYTTCGGDCNDNDPTVYPGAVEVCDGKDNDCDGEIDEGFDKDGDGYTTCNGDCNDNDPGVYPGATELDDGKDNDCDGQIDEGITRDNDNDGYSPPQDCNDNDPSIHPGATELCDGKDNDCDGQIDEGFDKDGDGYTTCGGDCDDYDPTVYPGAVELDDGKDNDCDGEIDEGFDKDVSTLPPPAVITRNDEEGEGRIVLSWNKVPGADSYDVEISKSKTFPSEFTDKSNFDINSTSTRVKLPPGKYYWRVRAKNEFNTSEWSKGDHYFIILGLPLWKKIIENPTTYLMAIIFAILLIDRVLALVSKKNVGE